MLIKIKKNLMYTLTRRVIPHFFFNFFHYNVVDDNEEILLLELFLK